MKCFAAYFTSFSWYISTTYGLDLTANFSIFQLRGICTFMFTVALNFLRTCLVTNFGDKLKRNRGLLEFAHLLKITISDFLDLYGFYYMN